MPDQDQQHPANAEVERQAVAQREGDLTSQLAEMRDRWVRAEAEIANVRNRARRDIDDARSFGIQKFANDMVEAAENLRRGFDSLPPKEPGEPQNLSGLRSGLADIERGFLDALGRNGIKRNDPTGDVFSPALHQAIGQRAVASQPAGTVAHAISPVWTLNGRLLRPAMVLVATPSADPMSAGPQA